MVCKQCGSTNVNIKLISRARNQGCLITAIHIFLTIITLGMWVIIPAVRGGIKSKIIKFAICQNCGYCWKI